MHLDETLQHIICASNEAQNSSSPSQSIGLSGAHVSVYARSLFVKLCGVGSAYVFVHFGRLL
jgi:hypothetical protein